MHFLLLRLLGQGAPLPALEPAPYVGVGLSDAHLYADGLKAKFRYINSFFHQAPFLDIANPSKAWLASSDFLISSDVFEHVVPPVSAAFAGAAAILRPGGVFVLTVPFHEGPNTVERFPDLHDYRLFQDNDEWVMENRTVTGETQIHRNLIFHGGPGVTLEMRLFALNDIIANLTAAGFRDIVVHRESVPEWGIYPPAEGASVPITAIRG